MILSAHQEALALISRTTAQKVKNRWRLGVSLYTQKINMAGVAPNPCPLR